MSKEKFVNFARGHSELAREVLKGNVSWQQLYELYEIYGENHSIWNTYLNNNGSNSIDLSSFKELFQMIKNVDLNNLQNGINNLQKTIGLLQDIGIGSNNNRRLL